MSAAESSSLPSLAVLRERILGRGLLAAAVVGGLSMPMNLWASFRSGAWVVAAVDVLVYAWVLVLWRSPRMGLERRAAHFVALLHLLGAMLTIGLGPTGVGLVWLLGATTLGGALGGVRTARAGLLFQALVLAGAGYVFATQPPFWVTGLVLPKAAWAVFAVNTVVLSAMCSLPVASLLAGLSSSVESRDAARAALDVERQRLLEANAALEAAAAEREVTEAKLRQAQKLEALGTLSGGMAHDFNNLLQPILVLASTAREDLPRDSALHQDLLDIESAALRGRELVRRILRFTRRGDADRREVHLGEQAREALALVAPTLPANVTQAVSAVDADDVVWADPAEIQQIVANLAHNAVQAMRARGGKLAVEITGDAERLTLSVRDEGEGMSSAVLERIFEPFFTTKPAGLGTGLGLWVVHNLVRELGGQIAVESTPGVGSCFRVELPRARVAPPLRVVGTPSPPPGGALRVLLVDDDAQVSSATARALERAGHQVTVVGDARDARARFVADPWAFDAVITDHTMPHVTGLELSAALRSARPSVPIVLCTGRVEPGVLEAVATARVALLHKPAAVAELLSVLAREVAAARGREARAG